MKGDDFKGNGRILCFVCNQPTRDHNGYSECTNGSDEVHPDRVEELKGKRAWTNAPNSPGRACMDMQGTDGGYKRHRAKHETACRPCLDAHNELTKAQYHQRKENSE